MRAARFVAAHWLLAFGQISLQIGTTGCVTLRELAIQLLPKPAKPASKAPSWWREAAEVRDGEDD